MDALENIAFSRRTKHEDTPQSMEGMNLGITATNLLSTDVFMAWKHPDHTHERSASGMHARPMRIAAGETASISTLHRHSFYIWDAEEGEHAPLHRGDASSKRWVRQVSANGFKHGTNVDIVIDASFQVVVVNLGSEDRELFLSEGDGEGGVTHTVSGGGGSVYLTMLDEQIIEIRDKLGASNRKVIVHRSGGDPQLLPLLSNDDEGISTRNEL